MINGKTFYQVLGVLNTAEDLVIRAAYRSLSNKYHPDKCTGEKEVAHERMSEINAAYETLGDTAKRQRYDEELKRQGKYDDAADIDNDTSDFEGIYSEHSDAWDIAIQFFPDLSALHERLRKINSSLAYTLKTILIERKDFDKREEIATRLERAFLTKYFGNDEEIVAFARLLIDNNFRGAARELNRIASVMGASVGADRIKSLLYNKHPDLQALHILETFKAGAQGQHLSYAEITSILERVGATQIERRNGFFSESFSFNWTDGKRMTFKVYWDLVDFIRDKALPRYKL